jgi:hypothetical protein
LVGASGVHQELSRGWEGGLRNFPGSQNRVRLGVGKGNSGTPKFFGQWHNSGLVEEKPGVLTGFSTGIPGRKGGCIVL